MIHFQLDMSKLYEDFEITDLYNKKYQYSNHKSKLFREQDLFMSTSILLIVGLIMSALFGGIINKLITVILNEAIFTITDIIFNLNLFGLILIGIKTLHDSIIRTYLVHSILVRFELSMKIEDIHKYLHNEWGIIINV